MDSANGDYPYIPGLLYCLTVAILAHATSSLATKWSPVMWALFYSILLANIFVLPRRLIPGVNFCSYQLMGGAIAVMGVLVEVPQLSQLPLILVIATMPYALVLVSGMWLGKTLHLDEGLAVLIESGATVYGRDTISLTAGRIDAEEETFRAATSCTAVISLLATLAVTFLITCTPFRQFLERRADVLAIVVGSSIPEVSYLVAVLSMSGFIGVGQALTVKTIRVLVTAPVMRWIVKRFREKQNGSTISSAGLGVPWYVWGFILSMLLGHILNAYAPNMGTLGSFWGTARSSLSGYALPLLTTVGLAGVGSQMKFRDMLEMGLRPLMFGLSTVIMLGASTIMILVLSTSQ